MELSCRLTPQLVPKGRKEHIHFKSHPTAYSFNKQLLSTEQRGVGKMNNFKTPFPAL